jgi:hypothetical protein
MQVNESFEQQLFSLCRSAISNLQVAEGIFKTLTALNNWPNASGDDEEKSKVFAKNNYHLIFDFTEEYEEQIFELEQIGKHPVIAHLKELDAVSNALLCLLICIDELGIQGTAGASKAGDYMIDKIKKQIELYLPENTIKHSRQIAA